METQIQNRTNQIRRSLLQVDTPRKWAALGLGAATFLGMFLAEKTHWYFWLIAAALAVAHYLVASIPKYKHDNAQTRRISLIWGLVMMVYMSSILSVMVGTLTVYKPFEGKFVLNMLCCCIICGTFLTLFGSWRWAINASAILLLIVGTVNGYVFVFRDREFTFLDIFAASTALEVSGQYSFAPSEYILCGWSLAALGLMFQACLPKLPARRPLMNRLEALLTVVMALLALSLGARNHLPERWRVNGSRKNGYLLNFYLGVRDAFVRMPENYSVETVGRLEQEYIAEVEPGTAGPNVLVIMNESYSDLTIYPNELTSNMENGITPYWHSLTENTIRGYALASVYGGNTANSEFEFLTGSTMAFLPNGSVPYTQYIDDNSYSLAWVLKSYGYTTLASHCYHAMGWNRDLIYPLIGFDSSTFMDQYPQLDLVRSYISDREQYDMMLQMLDAQEGPAFIFGITMQNHGGYNKSGYEHTVQLTGEYEGFSNAEQYLSLINTSDQALEYLLTTLESYPEDTIVLIFGDHQPKVESAFYETLNGGPLNTLDEQMLQHTVPFLIWANYDIEEKDLGLTSLNFLAGHLLDAAGLPRTAYHKYLGELEQTIPAMNALGYFSLEQGKFLTYAEATGPEQLAINDYELIQYNALFDRENSSILFFDQYLPTDEPQDTQQIPDAP